MSEREQEREEYETKINELKQMLSHKSSQYVENNDLAVQKVILHIKLLKITKKKK